MKKKIPEGDNIIIEQMIKDVYVPNVLSLFSKGNMNERPDVMESSSYMMLMQHFAKQFYYINSLILDIYLYQKKDASPKKELFNLNSLLQDLQVLFAHQAKSQKVVLKDRWFFDDSKAYFLFDRNRLEQLLFVFIARYIKNCQNENVYWGYEYLAHEEQLIFYINNTDAGIPDNFQVLTPYKVPSENCVEMRVIYLVTDFLKGHFYVVREEKNVAFYLSFHAQNACLTPSSP